MALSRDTLAVIERERNEYERALRTRREARNLIGRLCTQCDMADPDEHAVYELAIAGAERDLLAASDAARDALARAERARLSGRS